jgi:hypothetical protein
MREEDETKLIREYEHARAIIMNEKVWIARFILYKKFCILDFDERWASGEGSHS